MAASLLGGCNELPNDKICTTPRPLVVAPDPSSEVTTSAIGRWSEVRKEGDECVHRWSYRLAGAPEPVDVVARAAVGACSDLIGLTAGAWQEADQPGPGLMTSYRTGGTVTAEERTFEDFSMKAVFYVVQARAGHCAVQ